MLTEAINTAIEAGAAPENILVRGDSAYCAGKVIAGWDQGLIGVNVGSRVQPDIPANLAYGDNASGGVPADPLRFVVDVLAAA